MAHNCWTDPKNADKWPNSYKVPEIAAASAGKSSKELQLASVMWGTYAKAFAKDDCESEDDFVVVCKEMYETQEKELDTETML